MGICSLLMICGFYINELTKHVGVQPEQKQSQKPYGFGRRKDRVGMHTKNRWHLPLGAFAVIAFVALAFGLCSTNTALADPGGGQVVISQDLTINSPPATDTANTAIALDTSPPAALVVNNNANTGTMAIDTSPPNTTTANNNTITATTATTVTLNTCANELALTNERACFGTESVIATANQTLTNATAQVANTEGANDVAFPNSQVAAGFAKVGLQFAG